MSTKMLHFLNALARAFEQNRLLDLAEHFVFPVPVYIHKGLLVFGSADTLSEALEEYRKTAEKSGIIRLVPRVIAEGLSIKRQSNMWVELDHLDANGTCLRTSQIRFMMRHTEGNFFPQVELVDYQVTAFPELAEHLPLAMPA